MNVEPTSTVSSTEACRQAGVTYRQLTYWSERGFIDGQEPGRGTKGTGDPRRWTPEQVDRLRAIKKAIDDARQVLADAGLQGHSRLLQGAASR